MSADERVADLDGLRHRFELTGNPLYAWVAIRACLASSRGGPRLTLPDWVLGYLARVAEDFSDLGTFVDPRNRPRQADGESDWYFGVPGKGEPDWAPELPEKGMPAARLAHDRYNRPVNPEKVLEHVLFALAHCTCSSLLFWQTSLPVQMIPFEQVML